jgi:hypothetical protein
MYTLIRGAITDWYPYPFLDPDLERVGSIIATCLAITAVFVVVAAFLWWWSGRRRPLADGRPAELTTDAGHDPRA